jgi:hypothetical protein
MTITISLSPELEQQLRAKAAAEGVPAETVVLDALAERLEPANGSSLPAPRLSSDESRLLEAINQGLPAAIWNRHRHLTSLRQAESLTDSELQELQSLTDSIELAHAERLSHLVELAHLRGVPVDTLMQQLGIRDPGHA